MLTRNIGKVLRGKATPFQITLAAILGSLLGFLPGFTQAPGLVLALVILLVILNANLFLAGIVGLAAKAVAIAALPISVQVGAWLLDGPTQSIFKSAINTPVLALFGLEYYAVTGGQVLGLLFGLAAGILLSLALIAFRKRMLTIEEGSDLYKKYAQKRWIKIVSWLFLGKKGDKSYADTLKRRVGNPIRILGVIAAVLLIALVWVVQAFFSEPIVTAMLRRGLEQANGATVDIGSAKLDLKAGQLLVTNLAMADPNALDTDLLRAKELQAKVSTTDLLTRRIAMDNITIRDASQGDKRAVRGALIRRPAPLPPPPASDKTIDDYIKEAEAWKQRLAQVREWLEKASGEQGTDPDTNPDGSPRTEAQKKEALKERLARELRENGYTGARAGYLIDKAPAFLVRELIVDGLRTPQFPDDVLDIRAENVSTNPGLVSAEAKVSIRTRKSDTFRTALSLGVPGAGRTGSIAFHYRGLPTNSVMSHLLPTDPPMVRDGTMDLALDGAWSPAGIGHIDLPLTITLHDATIALPKQLGGGGESKVKQFSMPLGLRGPMDNPGIIVDQKKLADALTAAGASELASKARGELDKAVGKELDKVTDKLGGETGGKVKDAVGGLLQGIGGKKKD